MTATEHKINYLKGDATQPHIKTGVRAILHVCNNKGGWGAGFVLAISRRWPEPEQCYRKWVTEKSFAPFAKETESIPFALGRIQLVGVPEEQDATGPLFVCNMVAQDGYPTAERPVALDYGALEECLKEVNASLSHLYPESEEIPMPVSIHMPRIGCGLAGGTWLEVERRIMDAIPAIPVFVYDFR